MTIEPGVQVEATQNNGTLRVYGQLAASGATFYSSDENHTIKVLGDDGGQMDLTNCAFTGHSTAVIYWTGSSGVVDGCELNHGLQLNSGDVSVLGSTISYISFSGGTPTVTGNTLTNSFPLQVLDPDIGLDGVSGNTYTDADPKVYVSGTLDGAQTWGFVDGLYKRAFAGYELRVNSGATLTIEPGVQVEATQNNGILRVYGQRRLGGHHRHGGQLVGHDESGRDRGQDN